MITILERLITIPGMRTGIAMGVILPALVFLTFRVAAVLADV
jgi:hypothetical protein